MDEVKNKVEYIKLILRLKPQQKQSDNKWLITLNGEQRLITMDLCESHYLDKNIAINSFIDDEIESWRLEKGKPTLQY